MREHALELLRRLAQFVRINDAVFVDEFLLGDHLVHGLLVFVVILDQIVDEGHVHLAHLQAFDRLAHHARFARAGRPDSDEKPWLREAVEEMRFLGHAIHALF